MFQVVNLWFANDCQADVNSLLEQEVVGKVASYKFVPLTYQIFSRLGGTSSTNSSSSSSSSSGSGGCEAESLRFQEVLTRLMRQLCCDHPHHALPQLFALAHGGEVSGRSSEEFKANMSRERCRAAETLVAQVSEAKPRMTPAKPQSLYLQHH